MHALNKILENNKIILTNLSKMKLPKCIQDHCEENKFTKEGNYEGGWRDDLCQEEEEYG